MFYRVFRMCTWEIHSLWERAVTNVIKYFELLKFVIQFNVVLILLRVISINPDFVEFAHSY